MNTAAVATRQETVSRPQNRFFTTQRKQALGLSLLLLIATVALYLPVRNHPFANLDDMGYVYENPHVQAGLTWSTLKWAARTLDDNNWHPLTWISHALDCQMFGIDPAGHHLMNVAWHAIDAVLLFWVLLQATGFLGRSFMVAALFALHPINVEAVAWVAERKTLLSTFFFLLALGAYRWYARQPGLVRYATVALLFLMGLMSKPQIITLPAVLLLWDYWPLRRMFADKAAGGSGESPSAGDIPPMSFSWLVKEKLPLLILCAGSALATMKAQHAGHPGQWGYTAAIRVGNAIVAYARYLGKAFWPSNLAILYPHPGNSLQSWQVALSAVLLLAITAAVIMARRYRYLPVGWFWFLGTMLPTIGLIQVGRQALADRYAYQSFLGLFILVCWGVADWAKQRHFPAPLLPSISIAVLLALTLVTHHQLGYWRDNLTMWSHAIHVTNDNWVAEDMTAALLMSQGHHDEAIAHYWAAIAISPKDTLANLSLAIELQQHGELSESIRRYKTALMQMDDPLERAKAYQNMALAYRDLGYPEQAMECLRESGKLRAQARPAKP